MEILDKFQEMTTRMIKTLKHLSYEESLFGTVQGFGRSYQRIKEWREDEPRTATCCLVTEKGTMDTK